MGFSLPMGFIFGVPVALWLTYVMWFEKGRGKEVVPITIRLWFTMLSLGTIWFLGVMYAPFVIGTWNTLSTITAETWVIALFIGTPLTGIACQHLKEYLQ